MDRKYLRENKNSFNIVKSSRIYAKVTGYDDAIFVRNLLIEHDWNLDEIPNLIKSNDCYLVLAVIEEKLHMIGKYAHEPDSETIEKITRNFKRNPNESMYGLNITRVFDTFVIKKQIAGDDYIFGYYDNLEDAQFVRNFLLDNEWDVNRFGDIEFDDETGRYKVVSVIDDNVYVLGTFSTDRIDLNEVYRGFLAELSKHRYGLSRRPHLDLLKDKIPELEEMFQVEARDKNWSFEGINESEPILNQVIFNLTPFQQSVFDVISKDTAFDEIKRALIRYQSKNFENKIQKNIDELIGMELVEKTGDDTYSKTNL